MGLFCKYILRPTLLLFFFSLASGVVKRPAAEEMLTQEALPKQVAKKNKGPSADKDYSEDKRLYGRLHTAVKKDPRAQEEWDKIVCLPQRGASKQTNKKSLSFCMARQFGHRGPLVWACILGRVSRIVNQG